MGSCIAKLRLPSSNVAMDRSEPMAIWLSATLCTYYEQFDQMLEVGLPVDFDYIVYIKYCDIFKQTNTDLGVFQLGNKNDSYVVLLWWPIGFESWIEKNVSL